MPRWEKKAPVEPEQLISALNAQVDAKLPVNMQQAPLAVIVDDPESDIEGLPDLDVTYAKDSYWQTPDPYREGLPKLLLPKEIFKALKAEANNCNVSPANFLVKQLDVELASGKFSCAGSPDDGEHRTGNDEARTNKEFQELEKLLGRGRFSLLRSFAKAAGISNKTALLRGLGTLLSRINEAKPAEVVEED